ncbi:MAG: hypothetical protein JXR66_12875 [Bacteroidales bacterium]|nr:hypothetical protein [Bacteroidales bacterium]MBN2634448.1 hypothetical protein [Bacteroidales bacterium]
MQNKLQELTEKIYQEGLTRGKQEAEIIISEARDKAEEIIKNAETRAGEIIEKAGRDSEELRKNTLSELRISFRNSLNALKQDIENLITGRIVAEPVGEVLSDPSFVARLIESAVKKIFDGNIAGGVDIQLPEEIAGETEQYLRDNTAKAISGGIALVPVKSMEKGFEIIPRGQDYKIRITEADMENYIKEFLRPKLVSLLFEEE